MDALFIAHGKVKDGKLTITNKTQMQEALGEMDGRVDIVFYKAGSYRLQRYWFGVVVKTLMEKFQLRKWEVHRDLLRRFNPDDKPLNSEIIESVCQASAEDGIYIPEAKGKDNR